MTPDVSWIGCGFVYFVSFVIGWRLVRSFLSGPAAGMLAVFLAPGAGLALSSAVLFFSCLVFGAVQPLACFIMHAFLLLGFWFLPSRKRQIEALAPKWPAIFTACLAVLATAAVLLKSPF